MTEAHPKPINPEKQASFELELNVLGMWTFLVTEIMFFGALFAGYFVYRWQYPQGFADASHHLDATMGAINTFILLTSSLTMVMAVNAIQRGKRNQLVGFLVATMILGTLFLGIKGLEYVHKFDENLFPGGAFIYPGPFFQEARLFFSFYYVMTGLHALHMIIGIGVIGILVVMALFNKFTPHRYDLVELTGLFWHFVDVVWIFLFPLLYLIDRT
jgi:cytochrome c oxidase subunit III